MNEREQLFLQSLAKQYPTSAAACTEIINLQSIMNLPKGTEHFMTDIHGEYEQFNHILKNGSGSVRRKINEEFGNTMSEKDKRSLATLIYYPREKLEIVEQTEDNLEDWYKITLFRLVQIVKRVASKYSRSKVRKALPSEFSYVIEELITEKAELSNKEAYYNEIIHTIIRLGRADDFIIALAKTIQRLVIDHLHIVGDIYDRGPGPHIIMDTLMSHRNLDIEWGNHDIVWMGAAAGQQACICSVIRIASRYGNLSTLEDGYGINLLPLATFAMKTYRHSDLSCFRVKYDEDYNTKDLDVDTMIQKAIAMIQFKLEGQLAMKYPEFEMEDRLLLDKIDFEKKTVTIGGKEYPMKDTDFPTVNPANPYALSAEEEEVMKRLVRSFVNSEKLQEHIRFLYSVGGLYKTFNSNLMYHGCMPMDEEGNFLEAELFGNVYSGKAWFDILEQYARKGYFSHPGTLEKERGMDVLWYIWCGAKSPVYGKSSMTTFERYFVDAPETHKEVKNAYYSLLDNEEVVDRILAEFGLDVSRSHIINGHVPVEAKNGESPVKCGGKLFIIDGGFSKAYQGKTGLAGYTLVSNSYGIRLVAHEPFESAEAAIIKETDVISDAEIIEEYKERMRVADTDIGVAVRQQVAALEDLLRAYQSGELIEKS